MINSYDLRYFIKVSETLNLREASLQLGVSQPALSHSLKRLESELQCLLFLRRKKGMALTNEGRQFLNKAKSVYQEICNLESLFHEGYRSQMSLSLGLHPAVANYMMKHLLNARDVKIEFKFGTSKEVTELVHQGLLDCALAINPTPHPELVLRPICQDQFGVWKVKKCDEENIFYDSRLFQTQELLRELHKKKNYFKKMIEINDLNLIAQLVSDGLGVGILPERILLQKTDKFIPFHDNIRPLIDRLFFIYSMEKKDHPGFLTLKNYLSQNLGLGRFAIS